MKVTFLLRPDGGLFFGGAEVQALETASALRRQGIEVEIMSPTTKEVGDVVHAFGHYPSYVSTMNYCKARGIPFVLSTIFYREYPLSLMKLRDKYRASKRHNPMWITRHLMRSASALLPNTQAEADQVSDLFLKSPVPTFVVPNGAEARFAEGDARLFRERFGIEGPFILNVARIEKRKNQLRLIEAVQGTGMKLVMIGKEAQDDYSRACRAKAEGDANITFLPPIPHDDPLLASAYAAAKVFALPSLLETPGIAALEASLAGARVVITPVGGAREYFGDKAWYVDSRSTDSIRQALQAAWNAPDDGGALQRHVLARYTWDAVGAQTAEVYRQALTMAGRTAT